MLSGFFTATVLIFFRLLPLLIVEPIFSFQRLPLLARLVLAVSLALIFSSGSVAHAQVVNLSWLVLGGEFLIGLCMAFGFHAALGAVNSFGHVLDQQAGLAAATVFDPNTHQNSSLIAELLSIATILVFLTLGGHHALLRGFSEYLVHVPVGVVNTLSIDIFRILGVQFSLVFAMVAPVLILLWLVDFGLAMISRAAPQANIYFVAAPIKIMISLFALAWLSQQLLPRLGPLFEAAMTHWPLTLGQ